MLESAARLSPNQETRARCLYGAGSARWFNGSIERAQSLLERALALTDDPMLRANIQFRRAQILRERGSTTDPCLNLLVEEASRVERVNPERAASMFGWATIVPLQRMRPKEALKLARRAERIHPLARASPAVTDALAWARLQQGEADARQLALRCASLAEQLGEVGRGADVAQVLIFVEEFDVARRLLEKALSEDRATGEMLGLQTDLWALSGLHLRTGELRLALAACREAVDVSEGVGSPFSAGNALPRLAVIEAVMGLDDDCRSHAAASIEFLRR